MKLTEMKAYKALKANFEATKDIHMRDMFGQDENRFDKMTLKMDGFLLDYSKNRVTDETMSLLFDLAEESELKHWREAMFTGRPINWTEHRSVL
ncbi:MAG: glucose-6-phosphate isomerase, partial [Alphaproteobacteria bacterium]|nr:glucose-6-phosphate isomerase [Alphaproteobacteria bacterium]